MVLQDFREVLDSGKALGFPDWPPDQRLELEYLHKWSPVSITIIRLNMWPFIQNQNSAGN
jgi:hypothetical protein